MIGWTSSLSCSRCCRPNGTLVWTTRDGPRPTMSGMDVEGEGVTYDWQTKWFRASQTNVTNVHTCVAFVGVCCNVADAVVASNVSSRPGEAERYIGMEEEGQGKTRRVHDTFQLLPLLDGHYWQAGRQTKREGYCPFNDIIPDHLVICFYFVAAFEPSASWGSLLHLKSNLKVDHSDLYTKATETSIIVWKLWLKDRIYCTRQAER